MVSNIMLLMVIIIRHELLCSSIGNKIFSFYSIKKSMNIINAQNALAFCSLWCIKIIHTYYIIM